MRALRRHADRTFLDPAYADPAPSPGEALIRPTRLAIGAADLAASAAPGFSGVLGHEFAGVVEAVNPAPGRDDQAHWKGKRVVGAINLVCGKCDLCKSGLSNHCRARRVLGLAGHDGCFADRFTLPIANLVELPKTLDDDRAVFAESLAAAIHTAQILRIEGKPYVTVLGDNAMGLLAAQLMARLNASVRVLGRSPARFGLCEKWGVKHRHEDEAGRRQDQDIVVDCTGSADGLALAVQMVRPRGKIILKSGAVPPAADAGPPPAAPGLGPASAAANFALASALHTIEVNELEVIGARCGRIADAVDMLARDQVDVLSLVTRRAKLAEGLESLRAASQPDQIKVLMEP